MKLTPTLWRTARVLASKIRLQILWLLFEEKELYVQQIAERTDMSVPNASTQLRALSARGLISPRREGMKVIYRAEANESLEAAPALLKALHTCYDQSVSFKTLIRQATAFTHERRIEIVRELKGKKLPFHTLVQTTGMSPSALSRHLDKLEARGFVKYRDGLYRSAYPGNVLGRTLLRLACEKIHHEPLQDE